MKTIIAFLITIYKWFISLFNEGKQDLTEIHKEIEREAPKYGNPKKRQHNNRKPTKSRRVQYVNMGSNGVTRAIYHGAK